MSDKTLPNGLELFVVAHVKEKISQWVGNTAGVLAGHSCTNKELLAVFNGLSDEDAGRLCDYFLGVEIGTITGRYEIIPCIAYDAAVQAVAKGMSGSITVEAYYEIYLNAPLNLAWKFVCNSFCVYRLTTISKKCGFALLGFTKDGRILMIDKFVFQYATYLSMFTCSCQNWGVI